MTGRPRRKKAPAAETAAFVARDAAKAAKRGRAADRLAFLNRTHSGIDAPALHAAVSQVLANQPAPGAGAVATLFPDAGTDRWVPIGPTVSRRGQAMSRPRMSGRVRDLAVSADGQRAYAATAKGGLWYSGDAGTTWAPVGGWAGRSVNPQGNGNMFSGGALLVDFGALSGTDVVLFGTGEPTPFIPATGESAQGGIGVLAALGPVLDPVAHDPWEPDTGIAVLGGLGIRRLARHPAATALSSSGADQDRVLAATTNGLFLGTRSPLPAVVAAPPPGPMLPPVAALPARDGYTWVECAAALGAGDVTDVVWLPHGAGTRIVYAIGGTGVFFSDDNGATSTPIAALQAPAVVFNNRISLTRVDATNRLYALAETTVAGVRTPSLWQLTDMIATPQTVVRVPGVPPELFGKPAKPTQAWYDHGLAAEVVGAKDRVYLGGSAVMPRNDAEGEWSASLYCFETPAPPAAVASLAAPANIARTGNPPAGDGADLTGLIGNNVHADVHAIRLAGPAAAGTRHVWIGCDGGVYVSVHGGRVNTFGARNTGLATLEPIFLGSHPTSSHFLTTGFQDNGSQLRVGDTVWEEIFVGDGGGTAFHPIRSDIVVAQYTGGAWNGSPASEYADPLTRVSTFPGGTGREGGASAFYSGTATVVDATGSGRLALGTNRVWLTDTLGNGVSNLRWRVLPAAGGTERDARPSGSDPLNQQGFGVLVLPNPNFVDATGGSTSAQIVDMVWQSGTDLLVLHQGAIVRYTNTKKSAGTWTTITWPLAAMRIPPPPAPPPPVAVPLALNAVLTAVATVPGGLDFYVATLGDAADPTVETVWFYDDATSTFIPTGLRRKLDFAGPPVVAGPRDPCFALVVDPANHDHVYAGTATGVWRGRRAAAAPRLWTWDPVMNGLPQATVQDLDIWSNPAIPNSPRLLRAAVQSRGVWEVDLAATETRRTYVRVHARDDRRILPTPLANPRRAPTATPEPVFASPDVVVRPQWPVPSPPVFHSTLEIGNLPVYDLWTFQTAFRWLYPSCLADGRWSDAMRDLVRFHRATLGLSPGAKIDADLWHHVVGGTVGGVARGVRLLPDTIFADQATVTTNAADALAVYRAPWHTPVSFNGPGTEIDLLESVLPPRSSGDQWTVFREPATVDVLLHHRDSRAVQPPGAFAVLLWQSAPTRAALLATTIADVTPFLAAVLAAGVGGPVPAATPAGWNLATTGAGGTGSAMQTLRTALDARLPRAVSIDIELSAVPEGHSVLLLALVGSTDDDPITPPAGAPVTVSDLVLAWPHAAMRVVRVTKRV